MSFESRVQEVRERRQRQLMLEIDQHGMELRPLTQAFLMLSRRNPNWWMAVEAADKQKHQQQSAAVVDNNESPQRGAAGNSMASPLGNTFGASTFGSPMSPYGATNRSVADPLLASGFGSVSFRGGGDINGQQLASASSQRGGMLSDGAASLSNTNTKRRAASAMGGGGASTMLTRSVSGSTLQTLQSQWAHKYNDNSGAASPSVGSAAAGYGRRPSSAASRGGGGASNAAASEAGTSKQRKTINPAFDAKTADAIQMGLALLEQQKKDVARSQQEAKLLKQHQSALNRMGNGIGVEQGKYGMATSRALRSNLTSKALSSSALDDTTHGGTNFRAGSSAMSSTGGAHATALKVDPYKEAPIPSLADDPTQWLRNWQKQVDDRKRFSKEALRGKAALADRSRLARFNDDDDAAGEISNTTINKQKLYDQYTSLSKGSGGANKQKGDDEGGQQHQQPSQGADVTIPDTIVWENNIPKGWFYYDKKERLVCKRKVETKAVQLAMMEGAKYENDVVAVLYVLGQSTLGGAGRVAAKKAGNFSLAQQARIGAKASSNGGNEVNRRPSTAQSSSTGTTGRAGRRDSLMTAPFSEGSAGKRSGGGLSRGPSPSRGNVDGDEDDDDPDEDPEERAARLAHIKKLKHQRYLTRAEAELVDDIQSSVLHCRFITAADLPSFLFDVGGRYREKGTCILQKFVYSVDIAHLDTFQVVWTPKASHVTRRQNGNNLFDERIPVFQRCTTVEGSGAEPYTHAVKITARTQNQLTEACAELAQHFNNTNPRYVLTRMICHFRLTKTVNLDPHHTPSVLDNNADDQRLVFLFCSSARVMPADTRNYSRLYSQFRVCLDTDVPIIVDEGEVAQAQSRLIALGTGPDGKVFNEADPYAEVGSANVTNNLAAENNSMLKARYHVVSTDAQSRRARDPYKTTNLGNPTFTQSVMVAAAGAQQGMGLGADTSRPASMLQSFLTLNTEEHGRQQQQHGDAGGMGVGGAGMGRMVSGHTNDGRKAHPAGGANPNSTSKANVLYDSLFDASGAANLRPNTVGSNNKRQKAFGATSRPSSPKPFTDYGDFDGDEGNANATPPAAPITVKAVMEHVVSTENYLRGAISANMATGGKGYQRVGEMPVAGSGGGNGGGALERTNSIASSAFFGPNSTNRSLASPRGGPNGGLHRTYSQRSSMRSVGSHGAALIRTLSSSVMSSARAGNRSGGGGGGPRSGGGKGVGILLPAPKMLVGMNPQATRHVVESTISAVGAKQCRAAYLDSIPQRHLTDAEKAELLCLKFSALVGGGSMEKGLIVLSSQQAALTGNGIIGTGPRTPAELIGGTTATHTSSNMRYGGGNGAGGFFGNGTSNGSFGASIKGLPNWGGGGNRAAAGLDDSTNTAEGGGGAPTDRFSHYNNTKTPMTDLLKASFLTCAKDHLMAIVYDCYGHYDNYRALLAHDAATSRGAEGNQHGGGMDLFAGVSDTFTFYLSPAIETTFAGRAVKPSDVNEVRDVGPDGEGLVDDDDDGEGGDDDEGVSDGDDATRTRLAESNTAPTTIAGTTSAAAMAMATSMSTRDAMGHSHVTSVANLLDKYRPLQVDADGKAIPQQHTHHTHAPATNPNGTALAASTTTHRLRSAVQMASAAKKADTRKVRLPPLCAPIEALFGVYLSRVFKYKEVKRAMRRGGGGDGNNDGANDPAHVTPMPGGGQFLGQSFAANHPHHSSNMLQECPTAAYSSMGDQPPTTTITTAADLTDLLATDAFLANEEDDRVIEEGDLVIEVAKLAADVSPARQYDDEEDGDEEGEITHNTGHPEEDRAANACGEDDDEFDKESDDEGHDSPATRHAPRILPRGSNSDLGSYSGSHRSGSAMGSTLGSARSKNGQHQQQQHASLLPPSALKPNPKKASIADDRTTNHREIPQLSASVRKRLPPTARDGTDLFANLVLHSTASMMPNQQSCGSTSATAGDGGLKLLAASRSISCPPTPPPATIVSSTEGAPSRSMSLRGGNNYNGALGGILSPVSSVSAGGGGGLPINAKPAISIATTPTHGAQMGGGGGGGGRQFPTASGGAVSATSTAAKVTKTATLSNYIDLSTIFTDKSLRHQSRAGGKGGFTTAANAQQQQQQQAPVRFGLLQWLRQYYQWDEAAMSTADEVLEVQLHPLSRRKQLEEELRRLKQQTAVHSSAIDALKAGAIGVGGKGGGGDAGAEAAEGTLPPADTETAGVTATAVGGNDSDSDFSDVDAPTYKPPPPASAATAANTTTEPTAALPIPSQPTLSKEEAEALRQQREHEREQALLDKRAVRTREQLANLSRRLPQLLHHYVLSFLNELKEELREMAEDMPDDGML